MRADSPQEPRPTSARIAIFALFAALAPPLSAIAFYPAFVTQDGPAHAYNAHVLAESLGPGSPFRDVYEVRWSPLPNWAGHLGLLGLMTLVSPSSAERLMTAITLVGVAGSAFWLRWLVRGRAGLVPSSLFSAMIGLNVAWMFGFHGFLLGSTLFPLTLGLWWSARDRLGPGRIAAIAGLILLGYATHLVSLGLTVVGLLILTATTPGPESGRRIFRTALALAVLVPLGLVYRRLMTAGGAFRPIWHELTSPWTLAGWSKQLAWVDPITLGRKVLFPFSSHPSRWAWLAAPTLWFGLGVVVAVVATLARRGARRELRGWSLLAGVLILGGVAGPDSFGDGHGDYLAQRVFLFGLIALLPTLDFGIDRRVDRLVSALFAVALALQSAYVWDYAAESNDRVSEILAVRPFVGQSKRIGTLVLDLRGRFRANPLLHADSLLGIGTGDVLWSNYEAAHYYFPVHYRPGLLHPPDLEFEQVSVMDAPADAPARRARWRALLESHRAQIDRIVVLGDDLGLDSITREWYEPAASVGRVRVWRRR